MGVSGSKDMLSHSSAGGSTDGYYDVFVWRAIHPKRFVVLGREMMGW